uniref:NADH-ubiquinone oxidoreductase chain 5 n=1 Tax=Tituria sagittata TaxID=2777317 RepID=A0A7L8XEZ4_9HEMI|nr:NADH dehydrogenase subunit 5 [Tituria sagittata]QOH91213.1 NADH dehydrogenase subunit 5 [Tituria sagittata]
MKKMNKFNWWSTFFTLNSILLMTVSMKMLLTKKSTLMEWQLMKINSTEMYFIMLLDWMSMMFMATVLMISAMIMMYSSNYMGTKKYELKRFTNLINLFILSMMLMIISPNMISIMLGWDGLGLVSYCLVIFYSSKKSYNSGMITCLTNRLGDIGLLISISWMMSYGTWHFMFYKEMYNEAMCYLVLISCFTKSAQMPFYSWLPEAMSAPTPISALVHSSTLVTAGVYLSIRFINKISVNYLLLLTMMTTIMSSMCANYEFDLKKIIALSTLSQLGMMMSANFLGMKEMAFMHLLTHATFKSLLFMSAGIMIYYNNNNQDIRNLGLTCKNLPMTSSCFLISTMALCGIPFMTGFYSKDMIVENMSISSMNMISYMMMYMSLGMTMSYSVRVIYYLMIKEIKMSMITKTVKMNKMKMSMILLTMMSVCFGSMLMWMLNLDLKLIMMTKMMKMNPMIMIIMGMWMGIESFSFKKYFFNKYMYTLNSNMWNILKILSKTQKMTFLLSFVYKKKLNSEWGELYGAMGMTKYLMKMSKIMLLSKNKIFMLSIMMWIITMM